MEVFWSRCVAGVDAPAKCFAVQVRGGARCRSAMEGCSGCCCRWFCSCVFMICNGFTGSSQQWLQCATRWNSAEMLVQMRESGSKWCVFSRFSTWRWWRNSGYRCWNVRLGFLVCERDGRWWCGTIWLAEFWVVGSWHMSTYGWTNLKVVDCHMAWSEWVGFKW